MWVLAATGLLILGLFLVTIDFILPSAGLLSAAGGLALLGSITVGYQFGGTPGMAGFMLATLVTTPICVKYGLNKISMKAALTKDEGWVGVKSLAHLKGRRGTAQTALRPSGRAVIDGEFVDVVAEGAMIDKDTPITVVAVEGVRVVVAPSPAAG